MTSSHQSAAIAPASSAAASVRLIAGFTRVQAAIDTGYIHGLERPDRLVSVDDPMPDAVRAVIKWSLSRKWRHLARQRIEDVNPTIPLGRCFWALSADEKAAIRELFDEPALHAMVPGLLRHDTKITVTVRDAAYGMKGCSSLGRLRFVV